MHIRIIKSNQYISGKRLGDTVEIDERVARKLIAHRIAEEVIDEGDDDVGGAAETTGGLVLVDSIDITGDDLQWNVTWDGDNWQRMYIETITRNNDAAIHVMFNGDFADNYYHSSDCQDGSSTSVNSFRSTDTDVLCGWAGGSSRSCLSRTEMIMKTGTPRMYMVDMVSYLPANTDRHINKFAGFWNNTVDPITDIYFAGSTDFNGSIKVYRRT